MIPAAYHDCYRKIAQQHVEHIAQRGVVSPWVPDAVYRATQQETACLLGNVVRDASRVLDVGIGPGFLMDELQLRKKGVQVYGIDIAMPYLERLWVDRPSWSVAYGEAEKIPHPDSTFDFVVCCDVIEHVLDEHQVLREVLRVLHPGGVAILRTPNKEDLSGYTHSEAYPFCHVRSFDVDSLSMLVTKCHGQELLGCGPGLAVPSELFAVIRKNL